MDAEIDVFVKDRVTSVVQVSVGQAETGDVLPWAEFYDLKQYLFRLLESA